jgi:hypothetical protein
MNGGDQMETVERLRELGYLLTVDGDKLSATYTGEGQPNPITVKLLLEELKEHKQEALDYLRHQAPANLFKPVHDELAALWQAGTRGYLEQHRPELAKEIDTDEDQVNTSWLAADDGSGTLDDFKQALDAWRQANMGAIRAYAAERKGEIDDRT